MEERLTSFQQSTEVRVRALLLAMGRAIQRREVLTAQVPFYSRDPEIAVKLTADGVEIWLYDQEASFSVGSIARVYESPDFRNSAALADALVAGLTEGIQSLQ